jgi:hypothetical protein
MADNNLETPNFTKLQKEIMKDLFIIAERESIAFFKNSFDKGGFTDQSFNPWDKRVEPDYRPGGKLLVATSFLKDSIELAILY